MLVKERLTKCYIEWDKLRNIMRQNTEVFGNK